MVVSRCCPSMTTCFETPTGTERAGAVTMAPVKCVAWLSVSSYRSRKSAQSVLQLAASHS
ncbi:MAG: hypothetical protein OHK0013_03580 [Sandaracinaceae bacterium]